MDRPAYDSTVEGTENSRLHRLLEYRPLHRGQLMRALVIVRAFSRTLSIDKRRIKTCWFHETRLLGCCIRAIAPAKVDCVPNAEELRESRQTSKRPSSRAESNIETVSACAFFPAESRPAKKWLSCFFRGKLLTAIALFTARRSPASFGRELKILLRPSKFPTIEFVAPREYSAPLVFYY